MFSFADVEDKYDITELKPVRHKETYLRTYLLISVTQCNCKNNAMKYAHLVNNDDKLALPLMMR